MCNQKSPPIPSITSPIPSPIFSPADLVVVVVAVCSFVPSAQPKRDKTAAKAKRVSNSFFLVLILLSYLNCIFIPFFYGSHNRAY